MRGQAQTHAIVFGEILRSIRSRVTREILGTADNRHAHVQPHAHSDHVLGDVGARAYADVEALGNDVGEAVVAADLDLDVGVLR